MVATSGSSSQQARVTYVTEPADAKLAGPLQVEVTEGDGTASVEGYLQVVVKPGTVGGITRVKVTAKVDLDGSGDPDLTDEIIHTTTATEVTGLTGTASIEPLTP